MLFLEFHNVNQTALENQYSMVEPLLREHRAPDVSGNPGAFAQIGWAPANATTYSSTGLSTKTKYWYRVRAYNGCTVSGYSNNASATTP
jgi:hypothetical protein